MGDWLPVALAFLLALSFGIPTALYHRSMARLISSVTLFLLTLIPFTHRAERSWLAKDDLMRTSPENLGMGRLEAEATRSLQARLQWALEAQQ